MSFRGLVPMRATRCGEAYPRAPPLVRAELGELNGRMLDGRMADEQQQQSHSSDQSQCACGCVCRSLFDSKVKRSFNG